MVSAGQFMRDRLEVGLVARGEHDAGARACEDPRRGRADARGRAGNDHGFAARVHRKKARYRMRATTASNLQYNPGGSAAGYRGR
jgi:hypothetical protein